MRRLFRFLLPPLVLLGGIAIATALVATGPKTERKRPVEIPPTVEALILEQQDYQVLVPSRGTLTPRTASTLVAEISGRIVKVSGRFNKGEFFEAGDLLMQIDPRDYQNAVTIARSELSQSKLTLAEEQARTDQALRDWGNLQLAGKPSPLLLRTPQLENAQAALSASAARLNQAELELERTRILAPYAGRILEKNVDLGQYVSSGTSLADIYASDLVEVRLPISNEQLQYIDLPETYPGKTTPPAGAKVDFTQSIGDRTYQWPGKLVRTEGSIDVRSRQLFVIAQIEAPYAQQDGRPALKIGQFVSAKIHGEILENVFIIPRRAVRGERTVHLIDSENRLIRRDLDILWRDEQQVVAASPLQPGDRISLTALPFAADGIKVRIAGEAESEAAGKKLGTGNRQ